MIELTYADMFLFVVILTLLGLWIKAILELRLHKVITMRAFESLYAKEIELHHDGESVVIRKVSNNV
jgi:hypothetical protein